MEEFRILGITCSSCVDKITGIILKKFADLEKMDFEIDKNKGILKFKSGRSPFNNQEELSKILPQKYKVQELSTLTKFKNSTQKSKFKELYPLFLIFGFLYLGSLLIKIKFQLSLESTMPIFMGGFFFVFAFFKFLDLNGFAETFSMYDPLAAKIPLYGKFYPLIELLMGIGYLGFYEQLHLILNNGTILILGLTTVGVVKVLINRRKIKCACLGTALNLPMTEATFIENLAMILMAGFLLIN